MSILRVSVFESRSTSDNFASRGDEGAKEAAAKLRKYWETFGKLPFDEPMMKVLTDPKASPEAWREAAGSPWRVRHEADDRHHIRVGLVAQRDRRA